MASFVTVRDQDFYEYEDQNRPPFFYERPANLKDYEYESLQRFEYLDGSVYEVGLERRDEAELFVVHFALSYPKDSVWELFVGDHDFDVKNQSYFETLYEMDL